MAAGQRVLLLSTSRHRAFLKACILRVSSKPPGIHEVADLRREYLKLLPDEKFSFMTPWWCSAKDLDDLLGCQVLSGVDRTPDQLFRYGMDKKCAGSRSVHLFTPGYTLNCTNELRAKRAEIWTILAQPPTTGDTAASAEKIPEP